jgi:aldose 1-epimerase
MALTGEQYSLVAGDFEATVVEVGGGLRALRHRGVELTVPYGEDELPPKGTGATLVPWPNRLRGGRYGFDGVDYQVALTEPTAGNAIHGLARWIRWSLVDLEPAAVTLATDLVPQTGWPFQVRVEITYALHSDDGLTVTLRASNHGPQRAPFGAGFHPYLSVHGRPLAEVSVQVPAATRLLVDPAQIPVGIEAVEGTPYDLRAGRALGELRLDDGFTELNADGGHSTVRVSTEQGGAALWFDSGFGYVQVFTPDELAHGHAGVAVEPMTGPADAFNSGDGLIVLEPGAAWSGSWGIYPL